MIERLSLTCFFLAALSSFAACNLEGEDPDEDQDHDEMGVAKDAFGGYLGPAVVSASPNFDSDGGVVGSGTQAFLSSVAGHFGGFGLDGPYIEAAVTGSAFEVEAYAAGNLVAGQGWAVYTGTSALASSECNSDDGTSDQVSLAKPSSGSYACFLTKVSSSGSQWAQWADKAEITYGFMGASPKLTCSGYARAQARCIPIAQSYGVVTQGSHMQPLNGNLGPVDWTNGKVCGLTMVNGRFRTSSAGHGVAAYVSGSSWLLYTDTLTGARVQCVR